MLAFVKRKLHNLLSDQEFSEILTGSAWALGARVLATGLGLISSIIIARFYGAEVMGIVAVINSFLLLASIFTVLGTGTSILRLIPEHLVKFSPTSAFRVYRKTQFMVIAVSLITGTLFFFGADLIADRVFSKPSLSFYFMLAAVFVVFKSLTLLNTQAVRGLRQIRTFAVMQILPQSYNLLFLVTLSILWLDKSIPVYAFFGGFAMTAVTGWVVMEYSFRKRMDVNDRVVPISRRSILSISLPMLMAATMSFVLGQTGVIMLGMFRSEAEVGYYAIAVKLAGLTSFIYLAIDSIAAPKFSEFCHLSKIDELFYVARKTAKIMFLSAAPILIVLYVFGKQVLHLLFGEEFIVAYPALLLLVTGQLVNTVSGLTGSFMNMTGNEKTYRNILFSSAIINVCANLFFIPRLGMLGAALSAMISMALWNSITLIYIKYKYGRTIGYIPSLNQISQFIKS